MSGPVAVCDERSSGFAVSRYDPRSSSCMGHNCIGHNYIGHNYIGHNYICRVALRLEVVVVYVP